MAPGLGLEPRQEDPESPVLPLHHPGRNIHYYSKDKIKCNPFFEIFFRFFTEICGVIDKWILKKAINFSKI